MIVYLNGQFVPEEEAKVSVFDRGFLYGDGLFEAVRLIRGKPFRWAGHLLRMRAGLLLLHLKLPRPLEELERIASELVARNAMPDAILRITISRGAGPRGYSPGNCGPPTFVMSLHPAPSLDLPRPKTWKVITSKVRLPASQDLSMAKTCNKLPQILAKAEAEMHGADEALLLNTDGFVVEGTSGNLFWMDHRCVYTPPLSAGILPGVTRSLVLECCQKLEIPCMETNVPRDTLLKAAGAFLSLTSQGVVEIASLDHQALPESPLTTTIWRACLKAMRVESDN